ncbi:MAG: hypothetical protein JXO49_11695 [Deltaproteobacteria bacterium]|nr:hypothetical protein [Candidatus Anaeroferrophillus wilburensis]MBN2889997.1 hypothetical protein [Deltaproteobacteria bacterium]
MAGCTLQEDTVQKAIAKLHRAFIDRPAAVGEPYEHLETATRNIAKFIGVTQDMAVLSGSIGESFLDNIDLLAGFYHDFWQRPFPAGLERAQLLFSAIMERMLKNLLIAFESIDYDSNRPITIDLKADNEFARLEEWIAGLSAASAAVADSCKNMLLAVQQEPTQQSCSLVSLMVAFLFGWWFGKD